MRVLRPRGESEVIVALRAQVLELERELQFMQARGDPIVASENEARLKLRTQQLEDLHLALSTKDSIIRDLEQCLEISRQQAELGQRSIALESKEAFPLPRHHTAVDAVTMPLDGIARNLVRHSEAELRRALAQKEVREIELQREIVDVEKREAELRLRIAQMEGTLAELRLELTHKEEIEQGLQEQFEAMRRKAEILEHHSQQICCEMDRVRRLIEQKDQDLAAAQKLTQELMLACRGADCAGLPLGGAGAGVVIDVLLSQVQTSDCAASSVRGGDIGENLAAATASEPSPVLPSPEATMTAESSPPRSPRRTKRVTLPPSPCSEGSSSHVGVVTPPGSAASTARKAGIGAHGR